MNCFFQLWYGPCSFSKGKAVFRRAGKAVFEQATRLCSAEQARLCSAAPETWTNFGQRAGNHMATQLSLENHSSISLSPPSSKPTDTLGIFIAFLLNDTKCYMIVDRF